ncbi:MAG: hypothetical protein SWY16_26810 [Cyanobacteriota bacterium]|nr:hypothetical protein [Cyanobacteriota bacterium]
MTETWIVFKADSTNSPGWEERKLMPSEALTELLAEEWDCSGQLPQVGDRLREYSNLEDPANGITHGRDGDWIVTRIHQFSSFDTDSRIVVCYCQYQPISPDWEPLERGLPADEMLQAIEVS